MSGKAHQHVNRRAEFGEPGQLGVAEVVSVAEPDGLALLSVIFMSLLNSWSIQL